MNITVTNYNPNNERARHTAARDQNGDASDTGCAGVARVAGLHNSQNKHSDAGELNAAQQRLTA